MEYPENHVLLRAAFLITLLAAQLSKESDASKCFASRGLTLKKNCPGLGVADPEDPVLISLRSLLPIYQRFKENFRKKLKKHFIIINDLLPV